MSKQNLPTPEEASVRLRRWAASHREISRVWLIGSFARGEASPNDIDVVIELPGADPASPHPAEWQDEIQQDFDIAVHLLHWQGGPDTFDLPDGREATCLFAEELRSQGILVYDGM